MKKGLTGSVIICFALILLSCTGLKHLPVNLDSKTVKFDKVRLTFKNASVGVKAKGYILLTRDSCISFKFWGPLGIELAKGDYFKSLTVYNYIENKEINDLEFEILKRYHIRINRKCFELLVLGSEQDFVNELLKLNPVASDLQVGLDGNLVFLRNPVANVSTIIRYKMYGHIPKRINIVLQDRGDTMTIDIEFISINSVNVN